MSLWADRLAQVEHWLTTGNGSQSVHAVLAENHAGDVGCLMAQITIRQLDDAVAARLRERAAAAGRSMEQEVRDILTAACADPGAVVSRLRQRLDAYGGRVFSDSAAIVREMRDQRVR